MICLFSYFRKIIRNFAQIADPLTELTKKGITDKIDWGNKKQVAFDQLKTLLCQAVDTPLNIIDHISSV